MSFDNSSTLTTLGAPIPRMDANGNLWSSVEFRAYQMRDYLELRAHERDGTDVPVMRLLSNADVQVYGELMLRDGGVRSFNTFGFTCTDSAQDVASFRSGGSEGTEVVRIGSGGTVTGVADGQPAVAKWVLRSRGADSSAPSRMALQCSTLQFEVIKGTSASTQQWGRMLYDTSNVRVFDSYSGVAYERMVVQADGFWVRDADGVDILKVQDLAGLQVIAPSAYMATLTLNSSASGTGKVWNVFADTSAPYSLRFLESSGGAAAAFTISGGIQLEGRAILAAETAAPTAGMSDPVGTVIVESANHRIWVRFGQSFGNPITNWWFASMTQGS